MGHGRALVALDSKDEQLKIYKKILSDSLSVRKTENIISKPKESILVKKKQLTSALKNDIKKVTKKLNLEVKVSLKSKYKGSVSISFDDIDDYKKIIKALSGE